MSDKFDPDPWTVISTVASVVASVAALDPIATKYIDRFKKDTSGIRDSLLDRLTDDLIQVQRDTEKLIRFLSREIGEQKTMESPFFIGETAIFLDQKQFMRFSDLATTITADLDRIQNATFGICQYEAKLLKEFGHELKTQIPNLSHRVMQYYRRDMTIGEVLEDALWVLKEINRIMQRLHGN
ncbi:hypothetical protein [Bartonella sp. LJL80]